MKKMIVTDLDGTLLNSKKKVSSTSREYLKKLKDHGYIIVIATGRSFPSVMHAIENDDFASYIISDTGALAYEVDTEKELFQNFITNADVERLLQLYDSRFSFIDVCSKYGITRYTQENKSPSFIAIENDKTKVIENCKNVSHASIALKSNEEVLELYDYLTSEFSNLEIVLMQDSFSSCKYIEVMSKGSSKYKMVAKIAERIGITKDEIIAFGDSLNDVELLEKCSHGVAVSNALPEVKEKADDVTTLDNDSDGVVEYLKNYLEAQNEM